MVSYVCEYCKKEFTKRSHLSAHQQTARYCLNIRGRVQYKCDYCCKNFVNKSNLNRHHALCVNYQIAQTTESLKEQLAEKDRQVADLLQQLAEKDQQLERLATRAIDRPTTTNTNNKTQNVIVQMLPPVTTQHMSDQAQFLSLEHIKDGAEGYARYAISHPYEGRLICTDISRKKIKYKDEDGQIIEDIGGINLAQKLFMAIDERNQALINEAYGEIMNKVAELMQAEEQTNIEDLTAVMKMGTELVDLQRYCREITQGKENNMRNKFTNKLIKLIGK